jgi:threonine dehydratase
MNIDMTLTDVLLAQSILAERIMTTPVMATPALMTATGHPILLKAENLQRSGSFKIRGASYCLARLTAQQRRRGIIAYSTGNHAQAVAQAAQQQQLRATIVMSPDAPTHKVERTRKSGATIVWAESTSKARQLMAEELAHEHSFALIPPYDHRDVILGQGTIGLEIVEQCRPVAVFVPVGGGGLIAGIALAIKSTDPSIQIIGVEPEWENDACQSFSQGMLVTLPTASASIADAIRVQSLGALPYAIINHYVDEMVTVSEAQIAGATLDAFAEAHLVLEPAGAVALAAAQHYQRTFEARKPVVVIASGGNTTLEALCSLSGSVRTENKT